MVAGLIQEVGQDVLSVRGPVGGEGIQSFLCINDARRGAIPAHNTQIRPVLTTKPVVSDLLAVGRNGGKESVFARFGGTLMRQVTHLSCGKFADSKVSGAHVYAGKIPTIGREAKIGR